MKCSNCGEIWFQRPDSDEMAEAASGGYEDIPDAVKPLPDNMNLQTVHEEEGRPRFQPGGKSGYAAAAGVFVAVLAVLFIMQGTISKKWIFTQGFYGIFGYELSAPGEGLGFEGMKAEAQPDGTAEKIIISGHIKNRTAEEQSVPMMQAVMSDENGETIERWMIRPPSDVLKANAVMNFNTEYPAPVMGKAHNINIRFVLGKE